MDFLIKQSPFSWTEGYDIYDVNGDVLYCVRGNRFSIGHQLHVYDDRTGEEVGSIRQKRFSLLPSFEIRLFGQSMGSLRKGLSFFRTKYQIDFYGWSAQGDFGEWDYRVLDGSRLVVTASQKEFPWGDTYQISIEDPKDEIPGLLLALAIDAANCTDDSD